MTTASSERVERLGPQWNHHRVLVFGGQFDTHIKTGEDYETRTLASLFTLEPGDQPKGAGLAFIPSSFNDFNGREHGVQRDHGSYVALCGDVDTGDHPLEKIETAVRLFAEDSAWLIYSTAHARPGDMRWRIVVPLTEAVGFSDWHDAQNAMFDFLEENGIVMDRALDRAAQPVYLPCVPAVHAKSGDHLRGVDNAPLYYRRATTGTNAPGLDLATGPVADGMSSLRKARDADDRERERIRLEAVRRRANRPHVEGAPIIEEFNSGNSISDLLLRYHYQKSPRKGEDWRSPHQTGENYATRVVGDKWVSLSASDVGAKVGEPFAAGCYGDAYDLFVHYEHGGDHRSAFRALHGERNVAQGGSSQPKSRKPISDKTPATGAYRGGNGPHDPDDWYDQLQTDRKGNARKTLTNLVVHLRYMEEFGPHLRFNEMKHQVEWRGSSIEDHDIVEIRLILERFGFPPPDKDVRSAVEAVARENHYNPVADYLNCLIWDKRPRLDRWMVDLLGSPNTPFAKLVGPKVLISAVARAMVPGCKVDTVLVLEGEQGIKKSTAIAALFGEEYTAESVSLFDQHNKMVMSMMGAWVVELAEFVAIARSHHASVKGLISMQKDRVVLPYAKLASTHPRRCVFFGTINPADSGYLTDTTGNRRYWPVEVLKVDLDAIRHARDQLWAEAFVRFKNGERWWLDASEDDVARESQATREEDDAWTEPLRCKLEDMSWPAQITVDEVLTLLGIPHERKGKREQMRIGPVLRELGYERQTARPTNGGKPRKLWVRQ